MIGYLCISCRHARGESMFSKKNSYKITDRRIHLCSALLLPRENKQIGLLMGEASCENLIKIHFEMGEVKLESGEK
jgi:hypothetical protein